MNARATLQEYIDAQESHAAIVYGLRSIKTCGGVWHCVGPHAGQLERAKQAAARELGVEVGVGYMDNYREYQLTEQLRAAKVAAAARVKSAREGRKAFGGVRQLRLAIAEDRALCFTEGCSELTSSAPGDYYCDACVEAQQAEQGDELAAFDAFHEFADAVAV